MSAEILINVRPHVTRVAYVENGVLTDLNIERKSYPTLVGSIHRGRVNRILPGMQAAFVDIGLERAGFLYVGDIREDFDEEPREFDADLPLEFDSEENPEFTETPTVPIQDILKEGQQILVQVAKDPIGTKGARLTTHISLPGRFIVYLPTVRHVGISRRIESEVERTRLKNLVASINPPGGLIVRTAGEGANEESLRADIESMDKLAKEIFRNYEKRKNIGLIHQEIDVELRALRDMMNEKVTTVWVDNEEVHKRVVRFVSQLMPKYKQNIRLYQNSKPVFDMYELDLEISRAMERRIWLKSGGYLVIDEAEALVVIDVNTGRFVGKKDLEDTILKNNLEAAKEIAHQLRIRNCGGIIIVDFIDMEKESHREKVLSTLTDEIKQDRARTQVMSMSSLGLVEITRKRIRPSLIRELCEPCTYCEGKSFIKKRSTVAQEIFRDLERDPPKTAGNSGQTQILVRCHAMVMDWVYEVEGETLSFLEQNLERSVVFKAEPGFHIEQYEISNLKASSP